MRVIYKYALRKMCKFNNKENLRKIVQFNIVKSTIVIFKNIFKYLIKLKLNRNQKTVCICVPSPLKIVVQI